MVKNHFVNHVTLHVPHVTLKIKISAQSVVKVINLMKDLGNV